MKEIGGYIELDNYTGNEYYPDMISLNCGRNCLAYLIESRKIKKIYLPYFLCSSVSGLCKKYNLEVDYYVIDEQFNPQFKRILADDEWIYIVNYYGQITNEKITEYKNKYENIIIDNAQAFFQEPVAGVDTLYTCRKFFGVPDGAYLSTDANIDRGLEQDISFDRMNFLLGRYEKIASEFYKEYVENNVLFENEDIKVMSKLTHNLLRGLNYQDICQKRRKNFQYLHEQLGDRNQLKLRVPDGAFMYPFWTENGAELRKCLQEKKIYIPILWPDVFELCEKDSIEYLMAENIMPLPIDQRYGTREMEYLMEEVLKCID